MIINKQGEVFEYEGKKYIIGEDIYATESIYYGLIGIIKEIRTDDDMETDNEEPDIYCDFYEPVLQADKVRIEKTLGKRYDLDSVIMAPSMIAPIREGCCDGKEKIGKIFLLEEDWAYEGDGQEVSTMAFTNKESAMMFLRFKLYEEESYGNISLYKTDGNVAVVDEGEDYYETYIEGFYVDNHYYLRIVELSLAMSESYLKSLAEKVIAVERREHLIEQIEQWEETSEMTDTQYSAVINDETLSERIANKLADDEFYWDSYWQAVSEVASDLIVKHTKKE